MIEAISSPTPAERENPSSETADVHRRFGRIKASVREKTQRIKATLNKLRPSSLNKPDKKAFSELEKQQTDLISQTTRDLGLSSPDTADLPYSKEELINRKELIRGFAANFLLTLNEEKEEVTEEEITTFIAQRDIFTNLQEEGSIRITGLKGYKDMLALARYYDHNLDAIPEKTIVVGEEPVNSSSFDRKVLVYVDEAPGSALLGDKTVKRPKEDALSFAGGEDLVRPDVYLKSIADTTGGKTPRQKESFTLTGCAAIIVGGEIKSNIKQVDISSLGAITVLPGALLTPAPPENSTTISLSTLGDVSLLENSTLGASTITCDTFLRQGELLNPHPNDRRVKITCKKLEEDNDVTPLNPRFFVIEGDDDYVKRQIAIGEVTHKAQMGIQEESDQTLEQMERSEQVSKFALIFLRTLNQGMEEDRIFMELFGGNVPGNKDSSLFTGALEEYQARFDHLEGEKTIVEQRPLKGIKDVLRLMDYYNGNPHAELPQRVIVLTNETDITSSIPSGEKALVYWQEEWVEDEEDVITVPFGEKDIKIPTIKPMYKSLNRPITDNLIFTGEKKPDLFLGNAEIKTEKRELSIKGFDNIVIGGEVEAFTLDIACTKELAILPNASLIGRREDSLIWAEEITQQGNIGSSEIHCNKFRHVKGNIVRSKDTITHNPVKLYYGEYTGELPGRNDVELITSQQL